MVNDRLSIYVPKEDYPLIRALDRLKKGFEAKGIPMSRSAIALAVMRVGIKEYAKQADDSLSTGTAMAD